MCDKTAHPHGSIGEADVASIDAVLKGNDLWVDEANSNDTARRWLKGVKHFTQPFDPEEVLGTSFPLSHESGGEGVYNNGIVAQTMIPFQALCAHHLFPVIGHAHVGYIPKERVVGLSKLARLVYGVAHAAPSLQEDVGNQIVDALMGHLDAIGAICVISATHGCMSCRGVEYPDVLTNTSHVRGVFLENVAARQEFFSLIDV